MEWTRDGSEYTFTRARRPSAQSPAPAKNSSLNANVSVEASNALILNDVANVTRISSAGNDVKGGIFYRYVGGNDKLSDFGAFVEWTIDYNAFGTGFESKKSAALKMCASRKLLPTAKTTRS